MLKSAKFSDFDLYKKLTAKGWKGKYFGYNNKVTYLSEKNETIAVVEYDNRRSLIVSAEFT
jgi:hypothetical protein